MLAGSELTTLTKTEYVDWEKVGNKALLVELHKIMSDL